MRGAQYAPSLVPGVSPRKSPHSGVADFPRLLGSENPRRQ